MLLAINGYVPSLKLIPPTLPKLSKVPEATIPTTILASTAVLCLLLTLTEI